jgi:hypothetical protein
MELWITGADPTLPVDPQLLGPSARQSGRDRAKLLGMFVRYFTELGLPSRDVEVAFEDPASWVPVLADAATVHGHQVLSAVGFGETRRFEKKVKLEFGRPVTLPAKTLLPMRWRPQGGGEGLFPVLDADLEIAPMGPDVTQLAITARYEPPFGAVGRLIDRAVLHRVAEATLKDFLDRVGMAIAAAAVPGGG